MFLVGYPCCDYPYTREVQVAGYVDAVFGDPRRGPNDSFSPA
jgi:hypothetical protein